MRFHLWRSLFFPFFTLSEIVWSYYQNEFFIASCWWHLPSEAFAWGHLETQSIKIWCIIAYKCQHNLYMTDRSKPGEIYQKSHSQTVCSLYRQPTNEVPYMHRCRCLVSVVSWTSHSSLVTPHLSGNKSAKIHRMR